MSRTQGNLEPVTVANTQSKRTYFRYGIYGSTVFFLSWIAGTLLSYRHLWLPDDDVMIIVILSSLSTLLFICYNILFSRAFKGFENRYAEKASIGYLIVLFILPLYFLLNVFNVLLGLATINAAQLGIRVVAGLAIWHAAKNSTKPDFFEYAAVTIALSGILHFIVNVIPLLLENTVFYLGLFQYYIYNPIGDGLFVIFIFFLLFWVKLKEMEKSFN